MSNKKSKEAFTLAILSNHFYQQLRLRFLSPKADRPRLPAIARRRRVPWRGEV
jgi:hypothetical protein